ncbi:DinB family protein [Neolewinella antarctica]|uniref:Damage-inducible protein DinB n=1 Tax=Neolewinella antarctica TaxID=442734 RepID=A0ABX0XIB9_9BACT|nr:DinB family protein [Neolewinella antarctica]NJC28472.1 putative damage-inducible protein DinB [Neolewinella antarctica]
MVRFAPLAILLLLCSRARAQETAVVTTPALVSEADFPARAEWVTKWDNSLAYTLETLLATTDGDLDFRPTAGQMTLREQFHHLATNIYFLTSTYVHSPVDFDLAARRETMSPTATRADLSVTLTTAYAFAKDAISELAEHRWNEPAPNFFAGEKSRRVVIYLLQDHATHHRAQTLVYLRILGHEPPNYRGW